MLKYYACKVAGLILSHLPKPIGYQVASLIGDIVYLLSLGGRASVSDNIKHVLGPEVDKAVLKRTVHEVFRNTAKAYLDLLKIPRTAIEDIERSITVHGWQHFEQALKKGKGVMLVTAHLGSFNLAAQVLAARSIKATVLVELLEPPPLFRYVISLRESKGLNFVPVRPGVARAVLEALRRGEVVVVACDRDLQKNGFSLKFFGQEASMPSGAIQLALRTGSPIIPAFNIRRKDGNYDIFVEPAIETPFAGKDGLVPTMEQVVAIMEKYIRKCPAQWVILSRVWEDGR